MQRCGGWVPRYDILGKCVLLEGVGLKCWSWPQSEWVLLFVLCPWVDSAWGAHVCHLHQHRLAQSEYLVTVRCEGYGDVVDAGSEQREGMKRDEGCTQDLRSAYSEYTKPNSKHKWRGSGRTCWRKRKWLSHRKMILGEADSVYWEGGPGRGRGVLFSISFLGRTFLSWKHDSPPHKGWMLFMTAPWDSWALMPTVQMSKGPEKGIKSSSQGSRVHGWNLGSHPHWPDHREWFSCIPWWTDERTSFYISIFNEKLGKWRKLRELIKGDMLFMLFGGISLVQFDGHWLSLCVPFLLERIESQAG